MLAIIQCRIFCLSSLLSKNIKIKYRTIILPFVLYGCVTWSLTLREECRLRVYENRVLRKAFCSKRDEVTGEWRILHIEELNDLCSSPNIIRVIIEKNEWAGHTGFLWGNLREGDHMEDPGIDGRIILNWIYRKWDGGHGLDLAQNRDRWRALVNAVLNLGVP